MGIKWRMSWLVLIDHPFLMDFHYRAGRHQLRLLPRLAINQGCTDFLPPLPPLLPSTAALCPPFAKPPPSPCSQQESPHHNPRQAHKGHHISPGYRKGVTSPLFLILWGGGAKQEICIILRAL